VDFFFPAAAPVTFDVPGFGLTVAAAAVTVARHDDDDERQSSQFSSHACCVLRESACCCSSFKCSMSTEIRVASFGDTAASEAMITIEYFPE
jgi:hypothetical protein